MCHYLNKFQVEYDCNRSFGVWSGSCYMIHVIALCIESQHKHSFVEKGNIEENIHKTNIHVLSDMQSITGSHFYLAGNGCNSSNNLTWVSLNKCPNVSYLFIDLFPLNHKLTQHCLSFMSHIIAWWHIDYSAVFLCVSFQCWRLKQRHWALVSPPTRSVICCMEEPIFSPSDLCMEKWRAL